MSGSWVSGKDRNQPQADDRDDQTRTDVAKQDSNKTEPEKNEENLTKAS